MTARDAPRRVAFLLVPSFALLPYASAVEPLRAANLLSGSDLYAWEHVTPDGRPVRASSGVALVADRAAGEGPDPDAVFVCAGTGVEGFAHRGTLAWIRAAARRGVRLGGISGGAYVLARAGVLAGRRCTIHWDHIPAFREAFPDLQLTGALYEIDRDRFTCSGGTAPLDLLHALISADHGPDLAAAVSEWFLHTRVREAGAPQRMDPARRHGVSHPGLLRALAAMEARVEEPLGRAALARLAGVSPRQLERLFRDRLATSPGERYRELRLERARGLLRQTALAVTEVALACGFPSASHFSRAYRARYGHPPRGEREGG